MKIAREPHPRRSRLPFIVALLMIATLGIYTNEQLKQAATIYDAVMTEQDKAIYRGQLGSYEVPDTGETIGISSYGLFAPGNPWSLVSDTVPLAADFAPDDLVDTSVAHGDSNQAMQVQAAIEQPLEALFAAAKTDGYTLALSSAYRSIDDQQTLLDQYTAARGEAAASAVVAEPGTSEHHTGLAVDITDASSGCFVDSDSCLLSAASAAWLAENAYRYGFVLRYPEGKESVTGIEYESWHYRYVGVALARALHGSDLTLDEVLPQLYPAYKL